MRAAALPALWLSGLLADPATAQHRPVERPARACPQHGPGFVEVPGTRTCIRIAGRVAVGHTGSSRRIRREDVAGFGASGTVSADMRSATPYGPLRTYVRLRVSDGPTPIR